MTVGVTESVEAVRKRIAAAAARRGRDPGGVTLIAVTKGHPPGAAGEALAAGVADLGEDRADELAAKAELFPAARWHMIGQLQTNKVKLLPSGVAAIHSVDRPSLIERLRGTHFGDLYVEVNVSGEHAKAGVTPGGLPSLLHAMTAAGLKAAGLMTVAPVSGSPDDARPVFAELARLARRHGLPGLSMGMSDDFEVAVEEGATAVRVGRAIFGERSSFREGPG